MPDLDNATPINGDTSSQTDDNSVDNTVDQTGNQTVDNGNQPADSGRNPADGPPPPNKDRTPKKDKGEDDQGDSKEGDSDETSDGDKAEDNSSKELDTSVWGKTGDEVGDSVLKMLQDSGISPEDAENLLLDPVKQGDTSKIDREALAAKLGKETATLVMAGVENVVDRTKARQEEVKKKVVDAAGGEQNWEKASNWAINTLSEKEVTELRQMLDQGGKQADFAAREIVNRYNEDPNNTALNAGKAIQGDSNTKGKKVKGLSRLQFGIEMDRAYKRGASDKEMDALRAQRREGRKQGL